MQIRLDELLENMKSDAKDGEEDTGLFDKQEEGPKRVASCPPAPKRKSGVIEAAIDAATQALAEEQSAQAALEAETQAGESKPDDESSSADDASAANEQVDVAAADADEDDDETLSSAENQFDDSDTGRHIEPPPEPRITAERAAIDPEMVAVLEAEAAAEQEARAAEAEGEAERETAKADEQADEETEPGRPPKKRTLSQKLAAAAAESEAEHYVEGSLSPLQGKKKGRVEHSGLIDVRQMAAAYLTQNTQDKVEDDEFATGPIPMPIGNESTSPLLLPQRQEAGSNKGLLIALGVVGLLAIIAGTALATSLFIDRGGRSVADMSAAQVAAFCEDEGYVAGVQPRASESEQASRAAVALPVDSEPSDSAADATEDSVASGDESDTEATDERTAAVTSDDDDDDRSSRDRDSSSRDRDSSSRDRDSSSRDRDREVASRDDSTTASRSSSTTSSTSSTADTAKPPAGDVDANGVKCDEVLCLVEGKGCCGKAAAKAGSTSTTTDSAADANLPTRPERADISSAMDKLQARLQSCGDRFGTRGAVTIKLKIEPSGKVSSASTGAGDGEFQACVSKTVKGAKFPATKQGASVTYPVVLR